MIHPVRFLVALAVYTLFAIGGVAILATAACTAVKSTLIPTDQSALLLAERDTAAILTRLDSGMPSADRALARGAYCAVDGVLWRAGVGRVDASVPPAPPVVCR